MTGATSATRESDSFDGGHRVQVEPEFWLDARDWFTTCVGRPQGDQRGGDEEEAGNQQCEMETAAELLTLSVDWAEQQFRLMGRSDARDLAVALVAANQGISLLTNTLRDPDLMARESRRLDRWIDSLA